MSEADSGLGLAGVTSVVKDLDVTARFYSELFEFHRGPQITVEVGPNNHEDIARMFRIPAGKWIGLGLVRPEMILRIMQVIEPAPFMDGEFKPVNQIGHHSLFFCAPDPEAVLLRAEALGGSIYFRGTTPDGSANIYLQDPDGMQVQVIGRSLELVRNGYAGR